MADKKKGIDKELIRELAALLTETGLNEIEIEDDDLRVRVARDLPAPPTQVVYSEPPRQPVSTSPPGAASEPGAPIDPARHPGCVPSPMVGTVYRASEPNAKPFVEVGDQVRAGQAILIIEAMKHMNEVAAPRAGKVLEIFVEDGQPVEYGEPLMIIE